MRHPPTTTPIHTVAIAVGLATMLLAPTTLLPQLAGSARRRWRQVRDGQAGVSEIAVIALLTGLAALLVVAYMAIVSDKVETEANNLPTSTG